TPAAPSKPKAPAKLIRAVNRRPVEHPEYDEVLYEEDVVEALTFDLGDGYRSEAEQGPNAWEISGRIVDAQGRTVGSFSRSIDDEARVVSFDEFAIEPEH